MQEEWKKYKKNYEVSNFGNVKLFDNLLKDKIKIGQC